MSSITALVSSWRNGGVEGGNGVGVGDVCLGSLTGFETVWCDFRRLQRVPSTTVLYVSAQKEFTEAKRYR